MRVPSQLRKDMIAPSKSKRVTKGRNGNVMLLHRSNGELAIRERSSLWQRIAGDADVATLLDPPCEKRALLLARAPQLFLDARLD